MYFIMTNDVETTSLELNRPVDLMAEKVKKIGLPRLLNLYSKYDVEATFFFTGHIVEIMPELVDMVKDYGHEIGCHGYRHENEYAFDILPLEKQIYYLRKAKKIIENAAGTSIYSFRAPELRINNYTPRALEIAGFKYDSSVAPQRFDGPFSRGFRNKIFWMFAPHRPYFLSYKSFYNEGHSKILEIPISALIFPFIGSTLRIFPKPAKLLKIFLFSQAKKNSIPIVFLFHPTEVIEADPILMKNDELNEDTSIFSGIVRKRLKMNNLGIKALFLLERLLIDAKKCGAEFISVSKYGRIYEKGELNEGI